MTRAEKQHQAGEALRMLDRVLAQKPEKNGHDFCATIRCLTGLREALLTERRAGAPGSVSGDQLSRLNAVISAVLGGEFPIGRVPWEQVEAARRSYAALLDEWGWGAGGE